MSCVCAPQPAPPASRGGDPLVSSGTALGSVTPLIIPGKKKKVQGKNPLEGKSVFQSEWLSVNGVPTVPPSLRPTLDYG